MAKRLLESLKGVGAVYADNVLLRTTTYDLSFWADDAGSASGDKGQPTIDGHIDITGIAEAVVLAGPGALTLTIEDGRRLLFQLTNSAGGIVGRGWVR